MAIDEPYPEYPKYPERRINPRERRATGCAICCWFFVLIVCCMFWIVGSNYSSPEGALGFLVLLPLIVIGFSISLYKICKNLSSYYKQGGYPQQSVNY